MAVRVYFRDALGRFASRNRSAQRVHDLGRGVAQRFVGGVIEASIEAGQSRARDAARGRGPGPRGRGVKFNRYGRSRQRVINRFNTARYSPAGQRINRRVRAAQRGYRAVQSVRRSRASARQAERITRAALRMNRAYKRAHPSPGAMRSTRSYASVGSRARKTTRTLLAKRRR